MNAFTWAAAAAAAVAWGIAPLIEKAGLKGTQPMAGLFYRCLGVVLGMVFLLSFLVKPSQIKAVEMRSAILLIAGGFLASIVGQIFFYNALKVGDVSRVVPVSGSYPFIAFLLGVLLFGESMTALKLGGVLLVVAGVWLLKIG